ncbi:MAG TPA: PIG-L family deacetylase [Egibacteraceae bacterium]|nr:PIG-L family deacetylase [Egibacteraceae bacterium]
MPTDVTVFSPHLDDGVLSASARLMQPGAQLVTVLSGGPPPDLDVTRWGRLTRAASMAQRHAERLAEDDRAVAILGCASVRLGEPEEEFRDAELDRERLIRRVEPLVEAAGQVWAPSAVGGNRDHRAVRDAVLSACRRVGREHEVFLFADLPYSIEYGWPEWVTGEANGEFLDADYWLHSELTGRGLDPEQMDAQVIELSPDDRARKEQAVLCYASQLPALGLGANEPARWRWVLSYELTWQLRSLPAL